MKPETLKKIAELLGKNPNYFFPQLNNDQLVECIEYLLKAGYKLSCGESYYVTDDIGYKIFEGKTLAEAVMAAMESIVEVEDD